MREDGTFFARLVAISLFAGLLSFSPALAVAQQVPVPLPARCQQDILAGPGASQEYELGGFVDWFARADPTRDNRWRLSRGVRNNDIDQRLIYWNVAGIEHVLLEPGNIAVLCTRHEDRQPNTGYLEFGPRGTDRVDTRLWIPPYDRGYRGSTRPEDEEYELQFARFRSADDPEPEIEVELRVEVYHDGEYYNANFELATRVPEHILVRVQGLSSDPLSGLAEGLQGSERLHVTEVRLDAEALSSPRLILTPLTIQIIDLEMEDLVAKFRFNVPVPL